MRSERLLSDFDPTPVDYSRLLKTTDSMILLDSSSGTEDGVYITSVPLPQNGYVAGRRLG
ncbi:hypothetical protein WN51_06576 [Melipona quadrifasciata]|uniref:Uncharacterized protein n=1 Tax=Melipona quadrifasciata TaxID=166423 RepID=A0A0N0BCU1_9HYME|nr:hypothetical protein WN51_06576 [Melipona quadrifasciata]